LATVVEISTITLDVRPLSVNGSLTREASAATFGW